VVESACEELKNLDFAMFYLGGNILKPFNQVTPHLAKLTHSQSTVAYSVNVKYAPMLVGNILHNARFPIDMIYADGIIPNKNCYITVPMVATQRAGYSDIEGAEVNYEDYLMDRYEKNIVRL
jgi:hypothetical protein